MFPILNEVKEYILTNIELFIIIIVPLATLILWIGRHINERIKTIEKASCDDIDTRTALINEKIKIIERDVAELKEQLKDMNWSLTELKGIEKLLEKMKYW